MRRNERRIFVLISCALAAVVLASNIWAASQTVTMVSYFPSPDGRYMQLSVENSLGAGTVSPQTSLDVAGKIALYGTAALAAYPAVTPTSLGVGGSAGPMGSTLTGASNTYVGILAGNQTTTGSRNVAAGYSALAANTSGARNTAVGALALFTNRAGNDNSALGAYALATNASGSSNTAAGYNSLKSNTASFNTSVGTSVLENNGTGTPNTGLGYQALRNNTGNNNVGLGFQALLNNTTGNSNVAVGSGAGSGASVGGYSQNIFIGARAGAEVGSGNQNIVIADNSSGKFQLPDANATGQLVIANTIFGTDIYNAAHLGKIGIGMQPNASYALSVSGMVRAQEISQGSDRRLKKDIVPVTGALAKALALQGVYFNFKKDPARRRIGFIAQDVEPIVPEVVHTDGNGYKSVEYDRLMALLIEAIKEQQAIGLKQQAVLDRQKAQLDKLYARLARQKKHARPTSH